MSTESRRLHFTIVANVSRRLATTALFLAITSVAAERQCEAVIITCDNPGPTNSLVRGDFVNVVQIGQPGFATTSRSTDHSMYTSTGDTLIGHATFPNFDSMVKSSYVFGTDLTSPTGKGVRLTYAIQNGAVKVCTGGETYAASGNYAGQVRLHSGNAGSTTTPQAWRVALKPEPGEVIGTPMLVKIDATVLGSLTAAATASADATWNVSTTTKGTVISGTQAQSTPGASPFSDSGSLQFILPIGSSFNLFIRYELNCSGNGAAANSESLLTSAFVRISAQRPPGPKSGTNINPGNAIPHTNVPISVVGGRPPITGVPNEPQVATTHTPLGGTPWPVGPQSPFAPTNKTDEELDNERSELGMREQDEIWDFVDDEFWLDYQGMHEE